MNRRTALLSTLCALGGLAFPFALPAQAQSGNQVIDGLNAYLNGLQSAVSRFTQENADGSLSAGMFYLQKPGQMRFEYDPPALSVVIADGNVLAVFDARSNAGPQRYPQGQTPLSLLSRRSIDITQSAFVRRIDMVGNQARVTLFDPESPQNGQLAMLFDLNPVALREWVTTDRSGLETRVILGRLETGMQLESRLFNIGWQQLQFNRDSRSSRRN